MRQKESREAWYRWAYVNHFFESNWEEIEGVWRAHGNRSWLYDEPCSVVFGFTLARMMSTDVERRYILDALSRDKDVSRDEDGSLQVKDKDLKIVVTDTGDKIDLSELPDGFFSGGFSTLPMSGV